MCWDCKLNRSLIATTVLCLLTISLYAQQTVSGLVKDATGEPVIGASVLEAGTSNGTITDLDGNFSLFVQEGAVLEFSYVGYAKQNLSAKQGMVVVLKEDTELLDEVVVTGYTAQRKADLTGAVAVVDMDELMKVAENNPMKSLQGRVAGVNISTDGNPSGAATIRIRGIGTLNDNDPLYIIDGVPTKAGMHELNANDIESLQVLKDASAASIYGSRAANGVIIITTKRGKEGKLHLSFDAGVTTSFYQTKLDMLNTAEYGRVMWQAYVNGGINPNSNAAGYVYDYRFTDEGVPVLNAMYLPAYLDGAQTMKTADTDWFKEVTRTGVAQNYNLTLSSGSDKGSAFFSLGYYKNDGIIKYTDFERFSARINTDYHFFNKILSIGENLTVNRTSEVSANILNTALQALPIIPVHTVDGEGWGGPTGAMNDRDNPVRILYANKDNRYAYWRVFGNAWLNINPVKGLNIKTNFGIDYDNYYRHDYNHSYTAGKLSNAIASTALQQGHWLKWNWTSTVTYNLKIKGHALDVLAGVELFRQHNIDFNAYREGYAVETLNVMWPDLGTGQANASGAATGYALLSFFGKIDYCYGDRYLASFTLRHDGSSRFGKNNRFATFPAFSLGWRINQEKFMEDAADIVSDLKLRFGWGQTGNQEISNTAIYRIYVTNYGTGDPTWNNIWATSYDITGKGGSVLPAGYQLSQLANDNLKWETTTQTNIGLDFGFLNQSLYGSAEFYIKDTKDILILPGYLAAMGEGGGQWQNGASMRNMGFEGQLGYRQQFKSGFSLDIAANISFYRNKITHLPESVINSYGGNGTTDNILGRPINSIYGYIADGLFRSEEEIHNHAQQDGAGLGRIRYRDINNDGIINDKDRTWIGNPHPDFTYGLNISMEYKGVDLSLFFQGVQGPDVINELKYHTDFWAVSETGSNKGRRLLDAWTPENSTSTIPAVTMDNSNDEGRISTYFVEDGSFFKLRNMQLGYNLPKKALDTMHAQKFRFYVSAQNLFTVKSRSFTGIDPENPAYGYPIPLTFSVGLNVSF